LSGFLIGDFALFGDSNFFDALVEERIGFKGDGAFADVFVFAGRQAVVSVGNYGSLVGGNCGFASRDCGSNALGSVWTSII
jgi:hypothetical protein